MDGQRFDDLARALAGKVSRRLMLKHLAGAAAAGALGLPSAASAAAPCRRTGNLCAQDGQCCSGVCDPGTHRCACPDGQTPCAGNCVDTATDPQNCGACDVTCPHGTSCVAGTCGCPTGQTLCAHGCVDLQSDPQNCGECGNVCPHGTVCETGRCACPDGQTACDHGCVDLATDPRNCGGCDLACLTPRNGSANCQGGTCVVACDQGYRLVNGECCPNAQVCRGVCCPEGAICGISPNSCCTPEPVHETCRRNQKQCGKALNNCGTEVTCGPCGPCQSCCSNRCAGSVGSPCHGNYDCCSGFCVAGFCRGGCSSDGGLCDAQVDCCDGTTCVNISHGVGVCCASGKACGSVCCASADAVCDTTQSCCIPQPRETTCQGKCGTVRDNCGQQIDCGTCPSGQTCTNSNVCCTLNTCQGRCGSIDNGCGGTLHCSCPRGQVCTDGTCCTPQPPAEVCKDRCGTVTNNCGQQIDCTAVCAGCCDGDVCKPGTANDLCGIGGAQCRACVAPETCGGGSTPGACGNTIGPGTCAAGKNFCAAPNDFSTHCNGQRFGCFCLPTTRGDTFCGASITCADCMTNADCTVVTGNGSVCVAGCRGCDGNACAKPCPVQA